MSTAVTTHGKYQLKLINPTWATQWGIGTPSSTYGPSNSGFCTTENGQNYIISDSANCDITEDLCANCTPEKCGNSCSIFAKSDIYKNSVCGACSTSCTDECNPPDVDLSGLGIIGWVVFSFMIIIIFGLMGYIFWKHSEDNKKEKHQKRKRKETNGRWSIIFWVGRCPNEKSSVFGFNTKKPTGTFSIIVIVDRSHFI